VSVTRDGFPPGVPCWVDVPQPDLRAAADFYRRLFGWEVVEREPGYSVGRLRGADVAGLTSGDGPAAWRTYVWVESADDAARAAREAGGRVLAEPFEVGRAGQAAELADPAGTVFRVWEARAHRGAGVVNAPGSWNWSDLNTPDPDGAEAFYGALFGWELLKGALGEGIDFTMWRLPGYADKLAERDPELRRRHAEAGVPEGFSDAIAWLIPAAEARWAVTFAVDDADATAEACARLGGEVVTPPMDAGPARMAVLRDPGGAEFTVSRYQPD
jgi:uncharacterized protein